MVEEKAMARKTGSKNRNYPALPLDQALTVATKIQDEASGMKVSRLTLAELLDTTPTSSQFRDYVASSRMLGLTNGGINADEFSLTKVGEEAVGPDEVARLAAIKAAVMTVAPYQTFFDAFKSKKVPGTTALKEFLVRDADVPAERVEECAAQIVADAQTAGLTREVGGSLWIDLEGVPVIPDVDPDLDADAEHGDDEAAPAGTEDHSDRDPPPPPPPPAPPSAPKKVFIAHGKNRTPLDQLKQALDQFKVKYAVAVDEPNKGRPISKKVAELMQDECSSGIFIFTADERFLAETKDGDTEEVWRPSENLVFELGAASILYENRIVIFKEASVSFPSDYSDLGYIEFEKDQLVAELGKLFSELVALEILEVRAKG
jgi:Predicted nucleotide-binding protein containing TIR-like domain